MFSLKKYCLLLPGILCFMCSTAQRKTLSGLVQDVNSEEPVPFASVSFKGTTIGKLTDSSGHFYFNLDKWPSDTLEITCVGYQPYRYIINTQKDNLEVTVSFVRGTFNETANV